MTPSLDNHIPQIMSKAKEYSYSFNMEYNDLINQGIIIFHKAIRTYNSELSTFNTWLYINLQWRLYGYCKNNKIDLVMHIDNHYLSEGEISRSKKQINFSNMLIGLSSKSRQVVNIVLNQDQLPIHMRKGRRLTQKALRKYLSKVRKWKVREINHCFNEIKKELRNL